MSPTKLTPSPETTLSDDLLRALRYYLGGRRAVLAMAISALALGAYWNWGWLVALGVAPFLVSILPCALMCALGLCMARKSGSCHRAEDKTERSAQPSEPQSSQTRD